jgi:hypothetical protein
VFRILLVLLAGPIATPAMASFDLVDANGLIVGEVGGVSIDSPFDMSVIVGVPTSDGVGFVLFFGTRSSSENGVFDEFKDEVVRFKSNDCTGQGFVTAVNHQVWTGDPHFQEDRRTPRKIDRTVPTQSPASATPTPS